MYDRCVYFTIKMRKKTAYNFSVFIDYPFLLGSIHFLAGGGGPEEFGGGSSNFDVLQRGGSSYSFGIN
jgi:hypothetical protein